MVTGETDDVVIRAATLDDAADIERIRIAGWRTAYAGIVPQAYLDSMRLDDDAIAARRFRMAQNPPEVRTLISYGGAGPAGFVVYGPDREVPTAGEIYAIYVDPDAWSRGHGRALLGRAIRDLVADGYPEAGLWVLEENTRARTFYERFGLFPTGQSQRFQVGAEDVPEMRYAMRLEGFNGGG